MNILEKKFMTPELYWLEEDPYHDSWVIIYDARYFIQLTAVFTFDVIINEFF